MPSPNPVQLLTSARPSPLASPALFHLVVRESGLTSRKLLPLLFCVRMYISHEVCWGHSLLVLGRVKSAASKSLMAAGVVGGRSAVRAATLTVAS